MSPASPDCVLVTGGAGYIGVHTCVELLDSGYRVVVLDNFCNSHPQALQRIETITGKRVDLVEADIRDTAKVESALKIHNCRAVIHFAGLKAVGESTSDPLEYYDVNVGGALSLLRAMKTAQISTLVFSSSATVYGEPQQLPLREDHPMAPVNPYGRTKRHIEVMLEDQYRAYPSWRIAVLRYFNPVGAHESGLIGEDPRGVPNNLMPYVAQVAVGRRQKLHVWGGDYPTSDGTGVRDYIHVVDLAKGHLSALRHLAKAPGCIKVNLGTGHGYSVLDVVRTFEAVSGRTVPYSIEPRRAGDVAACYADPAQALAMLGWRAEKDLNAMCADAWRWQQANPGGYQAKP